MTHPNQPVEREASPHGGRRPSTGGFHGREANQPSDRVRALLDEWADAIRNKDIERLMACYASDAVAYDMMPPLEWRGADSYRAAWDQGLGMPGSFEVELYEPVIMASEEVALAYALAHYDVRPPEGEGFDGWFRWTAGFARVSGEWKIVHEHSSVPIEMESKTALIELRP
jgi:ketosteroid isomerase-like protein